MKEDLVLTEEEKLEIATKMKSEQLDLFIKWNNFFHDKKITMEYFGDAYLNSINLALKNAIEFFAGGDKKSIVGLSTLFMQHLFDELKMEVKVLDDKGMSQFAKEKTLEDLKSKVDEILAEDHAKCEKEDCKIKHEAILT